jgi:hypothetical protein
VTNPPLATTAEDVAVTIPLSVMLGNDTPGPADEGGQLIQLVSVGTGARLVGANIIFTPPPDVFGTTTFTYTIRDDGQTNGMDDFQSTTGTVTVAVTEVNDPPIPQNDSAFTFEDQPTTLLYADLLSNDSAGSNENATQTIDIITTGTFTTAGGGRVSFNTAARQVTYTPPNNFEGLDSFTYDIRDNGLTNGLPDPRTATGTVIVNNAGDNDPPIANDDLYTVAEDNPLSIPTSNCNAPIAGLVCNDSPGPLETGTVTITAVSSVSTNGTAVLVNPATVLFTPTPGFHGTTTFQYTIVDNGGLPATGTVTVTVTEVNDPPVADDESVATPEDTLLVLPFFTLLTGDVAGPGAPDNEDTTQTIDIINVSPASARGGTVAVSGGQIIYNPPPNFNSLTGGNDTFTYTIQDNGTTNGIASPRTDTGTVTVTVNPTNDQPVPGTDSFTIAEDFRRFLILDATLIANDSSGSPDELQPLTVSVFPAAPPANGTLQRVSNGFEYTPNPDFNGVDVWRYFVDDGVDTAVGTVSMTVTAVNDRPAAENDNFTTREDVVVIINLDDLLANDLPGDCHRRTRTTAGDCRREPDEYGRGPGRGQQREPHHYLHAGRKLCRCGHDWLPTA